VKGADTIDCGRERTIRPTAVYMHK